MQHEYLKGEASRLRPRLLASLIAILALLALVLGGCSFPRSGIALDAGLAQVAPAGSPRLAGQPGPGGGASDSSRSADQVQVQGSIEGLPGSGLQGAWRVSGLAVQVTAATALDQRAAAAAPGAEVEVHGWLRPDGSLQADWIRVLSPARPMANAGPSPLRIILPTQGAPAASAFTTAGQLAAPPMEAAVALFRIPETGIHADSPGLTGGFGLSLYGAQTAELFAHPPQRFGPIADQADRAIGDLGAANIASAAPAPQTQPVAQVQPAVWQAPAPQAPPAPPPAPPPTQGPPPIVVIGPPIVAPPPAPPPVVAPPAPQPPPGPPGGDNGGAGKDHKGTGSKGGHDSGQGGGGGKGH